ncbi:hypothetical protein KUTeg_003542 [Tegillarca granosa]|uniref:DDE-1 domain-containing protein n=1 Tax=Tegillarca granosa TaxID=220873 RepID=A0ABQ9FP18_TEGGR|nr:hypothetical protein KUTeg_003542 [Tegillarca granosa]
MPKGRAEIRHKNMVPECTKMYFGVLKGVLTENNLLDKPMFIWNMDETLTSLSPGSTKVLARTVFGPLKKEWRTITTTFHSETVLSVSHANFFRLFNKAWVSISPEHLKNGFRSTGIYPWNPDQIPPEAYLPSTLYSTSTYITNSVQFIKHS